MKARIVLTTFGSLGDLHPYLALALGLKARGHEAVVATSEAYRPKAEALGVPFHPVRPDIRELEADASLMRRAVGLHTGPQTVVREIAMPALRASYEDTLAAAEGADLLVSHPLTYATPLAAEKRGIPWASVSLSPIGLFSAHDPPVLPTLTALAAFRWLGPGFHGPLFRLLKWAVRHWSEPWRRLRADLGLPPAAADPVFEGQHSPHLTLAMFSGLLAAKQPDWPRASAVTGFPFLDQRAVLPPGLSEFLDAGEPPVVFTLGSAAVMDAGPFYRHAAEAARRLRRRALLLTGADPANRPPGLPPGVAAFDYAPYSAVFPRAAAIVHQGGVGTTAEAMRSGRPMLVMPYAHDQPDNAARVVRLGIARTVTRAAFTAERAAAELRRLLGHPSYSAKAAEVGRRVRAEDGVAAACDALEAILS